MENATRVFQLGPELALVSFDFRANRDIEKNMLIPMTIVDKKLADAEALVAKTQAKHLIVLFASPVIWTHDKFAEAFANVTKHIPGASIFATDALDSLRADCNAKQTTAICHRLLRIAEKHTVRLTFVSGDIHNGAFGTMRAKGVDDASDFRYVQNWTSSPMCNFGTGADHGSALTKWFSSDDSTFEFDADKNSLDPQPLITRVEETWMERRNFLVLSTKRKNSEMLLCGQLYVCNKTSVEEKTKTNVPTIYEPVKKEWVATQAAPATKGSKKSEGRCGCLAM